MIKALGKVQGVLFIFILALGSVAVMSCGGGEGVTLDEILRASVDSVGTEGNSGGQYPSISSDGRYVAFDSISTNLVAGDMNAARDVFVHDAVLGTTTRVSVDSSGIEGNGNSSEAAISSDGRYVAFYSSATNLVGSDTNGKLDIFVRDTVGNTTTLVSVATGGAQGDADSDYTPAISSDGRYVAFASYSTNLVVGDTNAKYDIFVRDTVGNTTTRVSVDSSAGEVNGDSYYPSISGDGRYVAFESYATDLVLGDTNARNDIFVRDTFGSATTRVSVDSSAAQGNGSSYYSAISLDGRYVAFESEATDLVAGDTNARTDIFVRDTVGSATTRVSVDSSGTESDNNSYEPSISMDGRYVAFYSSATNLVAGDTNVKGDIFVRDTVASTTIRVSVDSSGSESNGGSTSNAISSDGNYVAFYSFATDLVAGDTNSSPDIFRAPNQ